MPPRQVFNGPALRAARLDADMTHEQLAQRLGVTLRTIQRWQEGGSGPNGSMLLALATLFDCSPDDFYIEPEEAAA